MDEFDLWFVFLNREAPEKVGGTIIANVFGSALLDLAEDTTSSVDRPPDGCRDVASTLLASVVICATVMDRSDLPAQSNNL